MPKETSTRRVREFRARHRQELGQRSHGGYRPNAGRPRGNRSAADRVRDYRQRQKEYREHGLHIVASNTETTMGNKNLKDNRNEDQMMIFKLKPVHNDDESEAAASHNNHNDDPVIDVKFGSSTNHYFPPDRSASSSDFPERRQKQNEQMDQPIVVKSEVPDENCNGYEATASPSTCNFEHQTEPSDSDDPLTDIKIEQTPIGLSPPNLSDSFSNFPVRKHFKQHEQINQYIINQETDKKKKKIVD